MSVKIRPYVNGGWEVDIRFRLPDGSVLRERTKSPARARRDAAMGRGSRARAAGARQAQGSSTGGERESAR